MSPSVAVVIVNYNGAAYVCDAVHSVLDQRYDGRVEIVVVDNASSDGSVALLHTLAGIRVIANSDNAGFGAGVNIGIGATESDYVALLNPDACADAEWLAKIIPWMRDAHVDVASSIVSAGSTDWFASGRFFDSIGSTLVSRSPATKTDWVSGCALVATRHALDRLGGFDPGYFLYYEDVDLSIRARALGFRVAVLNERLVDHPQHGRSTDTLGPRKAQIGYYARGRLIGKHVRGRKRIVALTFASTISLVLNRVERRSFLPALRSLFRGFREAPREPARRTKIGVLLNTYEHTAGLGAGGHRHFIEAIKRWDDIDIVLFGPRSARAPILDELPEAKYVALPSLERFSVHKAIEFLFRSVAWPVAWRQLRSCDALLATAHFLPDVVPAIFSGRPAIVIIHHLIGAAGMARRPSPIPRLSEEAALLLIRSGAREVLVSSNLVANELRTRSFHMPIAVTTSGVDHIEVTHDVAERTGALFIGRLHPAKGALDAVRAWQGVVRYDDSAVLTLLGAREDEAYARDVEAFVAAASLERNVRILGKVSEARKLDELAKASIFLFPSHEEGWGIALAEAMCAGLPCVTYALPIFAEIFPHGRLEAPLGDVDALAAVVERLMRDEDLRASVALEAATLARDFTWARTSAIERRAVEAHVRKA